MADTIEDTIEETTEDLNTPSVNTDTESIAESLVSSQDNSICDDLDQLLTQLHEIHSQHFNAIETLENIHKLVANSKNVYVTRGTVKQDFDELLETIHQESLAEIRAGIHSQFGQRLLSLLENASLE